jgi:toxin YhaV
MTEPKPAPWVVNGWSIFPHPVFTTQLTELLEKVEELQRKDPEGYVKKNATKRLAAINKLAFEVIPANPAASEFRQGNALGAEYTHWFRAKFFNQYRLFFRYDVQSKIIIFGWVNDEATKRAYGSKTDAYRVVQTMLNRGSPPDDWEELLKEASALSGPAKQLVEKLTSILK